MGPMNRSKQANQRLSQTQSQKIAQSLEVWEALILSNTGHGFLVPIRMVQKQDTK